MHVDFLLFIEVLLGNLLLFSMVGTVISSATTFIGCLLEFIIFGKGCRCITLLTFIKLCDLYNYMVYYYNIHII